MLHKTSSCHQLSDKVSSADHAIACHYMVMPFLIPRGMKARHKTKSGPSMCALPSKTAAWKKSISCALLTCSVNDAADIRCYVIWESMKSKLPASKTRRVKGVQIHSSGPACCNELCKRFPSSGTVQDAPATMTCKSACISGRLCNEMLTQIMCE